MPLPDEYNIKKTEKTEFDLLPNDVYQVKITNLELLENEPVYASTEVEDKLNFEFTITEEGQYKGRKLWMKMRPIMSAGYSQGQPSWLYKLFCAVNQVTLRDEEAKAITAKNVNELVNKEVRVTVKQKPSKKDSSKVYNNITDFLPVKSIIAPIEQVAPLAPFMPEPAPDDLLEPVDEDINVDGIPF